MIASVRGTVLALHLDSAVVEVGGVGLRVASTPSALAELRSGGEALLHTTLVVREDSLTLFGFPTADERDVFDLLQTVTGVGPRLALAVLAVLAPEQLRAAIATSDLKALVKVPGIGRKGAERMVLDLRDKVGAPSGPLPAGAPAAPAAAAAPTAVPSPVVEALVGLGWSTKQADDAVAAVLALRGQHGGGAEPAPAELPALLRAALQHLGRR